MPNNKKNEAQQNEHPNPSSRQAKRTPSAGADKSGGAAGKQSTKTRDKGAAAESGSRPSRKKG
jgi:hypothetical protein